VNKSLRYHTIKIYLAGVRHFYIAHAVSSPLCSAVQLHRLQLVLRGVRKSQINIKRTRLPITFPILNRIVHDWLRGVAGAYDGQMLAAAASLAFFGFLRCGEFTTNVNKDPQVEATPCLSLGSISFNADSTSFVLTLPASKTDVFRQGIKLHFHKSQSSVCPVKVMLSYIALRRSAGASDSDPLFITSRGRILSRLCFVSSMKLALRRVGLNPDAYNGHSLRIGAATSAAQAQLPDHLIQTLGRWSSTCYTRYIHTDRATIQAAQQRLCVTAY
jgi:hypothetical protein